MAKRRCATSTDMEVMARVSAGGSASVCLTCCLSLSIGALAPLSRARRYTRTRTRRSRRVGMELYIYRVCCVRKKKRSYDIKLCTKHAARACWLHGAAGYLTKEKIHRYTPTGPAHPRGVHGGVLVFLHGASRGHESAPSCPNTSMRKRAMICGQRFGRGLRSSYSARRSAASATPGAGKLRSPRRICW